jgi:hypothetical protein
MPEASSNSEALLASIQAGFATLHELLLRRPTTVSLVTAGPALQQLKQDLISLRDVHPAPSRSALLEIQEISLRVQALYRAASGFFGGLSAEAIENGAWDAAAYSPDGEWAQPVAAASRLRMEG